MAGLALKRRQWAPKVGTKINWSHPLAEKLKWYFVYDGGVFTCLVTGKRMVAQSNAVSSVTVRGPAIESVGTSDGAYVQLAVAEVPNYPVSFTWAGTVLGAMDAIGSGMFCISSGTPNQGDPGPPAPYIYGLGGASTKGRFFPPNGGTFGPVLESSGNWTYGQFQVVTGVSTTTAQQFYMYGQEVSNGTTGLSQPSISDPWLCIGCYITSRSNNDRTVVGMVHERALSAVEAALLNADPFCMLRG